MNVLNLNSNLQKYIFFAMVKGSGLEVMENRVACHVLCQNVSA